MAKKPTKGNGKNLPAEVNFDEFGGNTGFEEAGVDAFAIPFLRLLQTNSPQVNEDEESYIEGAKPGGFFNTITRKYYGKEVIVLPVYYQRDFVEWQPDRGGFVRNHGGNPKILDKTIRDETTNRDTLENGNNIQDTRNHYVLVADDLMAGMMILSLTSTGIRHSRTWMSQMKALMLPNKQKAPMLSSLYKISSVINENDDGKWYQVGNKNMTAIERASWINGNQLAAAKAAYELIVSGKTQAAYDTVNEAGGDDDIPF